MKLERIGTDYGGRSIPSDLIRPDWVCYCGGLGEDGSFDLGLIERFGVEVWAFDPTPRSIEFAETIDEPRFHFLPVGIWSDDGPQRFYLPEDPSYVSASITDPPQRERSFLADCRSIPSLMNQLGHSRIDLLKLDIEGAEHRVLRRLRLRPKVICVELHGPERRRRPTLWRLALAGYRLALREGDDYLLVRASSGL